MRSSLFAIQLILFALYSCGTEQEPVPHKEPIKEPISEKPVIDEYLWINDFTGNFRATNKGIARRTDAFSGNPFPPPYEFDLTKDYLILRSTENKIDLNSAEMGLRKWTISLNENLEFSLSKDTAYLDKCNGCGNGHHVTYSIQLSGFFFNTDSLTYDYTEKATDRENATSYTASGKAFYRRIK